jgi:hypothetical protein
MEDEVAIAKFANQNMPEGMDEEMQVGDAQLELEKRNPADQLKTEEDEKEQGDAFDEPHSDKVEEKDDFVEEKKISRWRVVVGTSNGFHHR